LRKDYEETDLTKHLQNDIFNEFDKPIELPVIRKPCQGLS
ncbi:14152_t:CDS:2, partial [Funneliformis geosporum]